VKKIIIFSLLFLLFPIVVFASSDYDITKYKINVDVEKNGISKYEETLTLNFFGNDKSIIRNVDESTKKIKINKNYTLETNKTSIAKIYARYKNDDIVLKYEKSNIEEKSNYFNIELKNNYDNDIKALSFKITLPDSVTASNISIKNGNYDITELVDFQVKDRIITGTYNKLLKTDESINIIVDYGRFYMNPATLTCTIVPIALAFFSYLLWLFFGKDLPKRIEKTSKFPRNITNLHIALADKGVINHEDTYYMLLSLASRGFLTIVEEADDFYFVKNKNYNSTNYMESVFFKTLFRAGESISLSEYINIVSERKDDKTKIYQADRVEEDNIKRKFNIASNTVIKILESQNESNKYYEEKPEQIKKILIIMIALILILITSLPFLEINMLTLLPISIILSVATLQALVFFINNINVHSRKDKAITIACLALIILILVLVPSFRRNLGYIIASVTSLISSGIILLIYRYMPKRTIYGQGIYNKTEGFKEFINNITDEELNRLTEINENYLLEVLPVSYQLGVADKVLELLRKNKVKEPEWFKLSSSFSYIKLHKAILKLKKKLTIDE